MTRATPATPRTAAGRALQKHLAGGGGGDIPAMIAAIEAEAASPAADGLDVDALAAAAYADRPPLGRGKVPWPPSARRDWTAWAQRIAARLAAPPRPHDEGGKPRAKHDDWWYEDGEPIP